MEMCRSKIIILSLLTIIISTAYSVVLECKDGKKEICFNGKISIKNKGTSIELKTNKRISDIKTLFLKDAVVHVLPANIHEAFPNLEVLKIVNSSLSAIEKSDFTGLEKVEQVNFEKNLISNLPADALHLLENLSILNLDYNKISAIPKNIFTNNQKLTEISLVGNGIEQLHEQTFKNLVNLQFIFLSNNNIEDLRDGTFDDCKELEEISIDNNKLKYAPRKIFDKNEKLTFSKRNFVKNKCIDSYLENLSLDNLDDLKDAFEDSCKPYNQGHIDELKAQITELEGEKENLKQELKDVNKEFEKANEKLEELHREIDKKDKDLEDLRDDKDKVKNELEEKDNKITILTTEIINLKTESADLSSINSKCQTDLENLKSLTSKHELDLNTCKTNFNDCEKIKDITLMSFGSEAIKTHKFESLNNNLTAEVEYLRSQVAEKDKIIADNSIALKKSNMNTEIKDFTITNLMRGYKEANMTIDVLSNKPCNPNLLTPNAEPESPNFYNIDCKLEENVIQNDKIYTCGVNDVRAMDCNAKLKEISSNSNGKTVTGISIVDSYFIDFPVDLAKKFENFKFFKISKSGFFGKFEENICELSSEIEILSVTSSIIGDSIKLDECKELKTLQIEASGIKSISAANPIKSLSNIVLRGNKIEEISNDFFDKFENLKSVQMSENKISYLDGNTFDGNKLLETVNLSKNPIKKINGEIFTQNSKLASVDLKQLECINKAEFSKRKMNDLRKEILSKCE